MRLIKSGSWIKVRRVLRMEEGVLLLCIEGEMRGENGIGLLKWGVCGELKWSRQVS